MADRERQSFDHIQGMLMKSLQNSPQNRHNCAQSWLGLADVFANGLFDNQGDTTMAILQDVSSKNSKGAATTTAELMARLAVLEAENLKLKEARHKSLSLKVSEKGAVSVYGLGRFPLTLYSGQWSRLFEMIDQIKAFIESNKDKLAVKE